MAKKAQKEAITSVEELIESINSESTLIETDEELEKVEWQTTNLVGLDMLLGEGRPKGRIIEILGPESSGKTALALHMMGIVCRLGGRAMLIDAEYAYDAKWCEKFSIPTYDKDKFVVLHPDYGEQALDALYKTVKTRLYDIIVVDSVSALTPKEEAEGSVGKMQMALQARMMSKALRKLTAAVSKSKCTVIFINQIRQKVGLVFGNPETTSGGNALRFYSSIRLDVRRLGWIGDKEAPIGIKQRIKTIKNKMAPPYRNTEMEFSFKYGYPVNRDILKQAIVFGIIKKVKGGYYQTDCEYLDEQIKARKDDLLKRIKKSAKLRKALKKEIKKCFYNQTTGEEDEQGDEE